MTRIILMVSVFATAIAPAQSRYDMVERRWAVPKLTPIIEARPETDDPAPFEAETPLQTIESYNQDQILQWLKVSGVSFPKGSSLKYVENNDGLSFLTIRNEPQYLALIDYVLSQKYPIHTSLQLLKRFLAETKDKSTEELPSIIERYPAQSLGPLRDIVEALNELNLQLASKPDEKQKEIITKRRTRIIKMLPESLKATRTYFEAMIKVMEP